MKRVSTPPHVPSSTGEDPFLISKALRDLTGATNVEDDQVGHYLAVWALYCHLAMRRFNKAVQYVNTASSPKTTCEASNVVTPRRG